MLSPPDSSSAELVVMLSLSVVEEPLCRGFPFLHPTKDTVIHKSTTHINIHAFFHNGFIFLSRLILFSLAKSKKRPHTLIRAFILQKSTSLLFSQFYCITTKKPFQSYNLSIISHFYSFFLKKACFFYQNVIYLDKIRTFRR